MTNAVHEKLSVRSPNPRGLAIADKISANLCEAEARALAAINAKADNARKYNERASMVSTFMKEGERRALMEARSNAEAEQPPARVHRLSPGDPRRVPFTQA